MKVLHAVAGMKPSLGGVCQAVRTIARGLEDLGILNDIVSIDNPNEGFLNNDNVKIVPLGPSKNSWGYSNLLAAWLKKNIRNYDIIIVHGLWQYYTYAVYDSWNHLDKAERPKLFVMPHGMLDPYFQNARGRRLKAIRNWVYWNIIEKNIINQSDGLFFTCEIEKELAKTTFPFYAPKSEIVVGLGIEAPPSFNCDMENAFKAKYSKSEEPFILYIGRIDQKKGVDILIQTYLHFEKQKLLLPNLVIAGPGLETPFGIKIQNLSKSSSKIYFTGMLTGHAKWGAFYKSSAFILPSHQENFGIAVAEALACGKAVLISDKVNIWQEIETFGGGIVKSDNLEGVESMLKTWLRLDNREKSFMNQNALNCFQMCFAVSKLIDNLHNVINEPI